MVGELIWTSVLESLTQLIPYKAQLRNQFTVSSGYVGNKVILILFPWRQARWERKSTLHSLDGKGTEYVPPCDDVLAPDL